MDTEHVKHGLAGQQAEPRCHVGRGRQPLLRKALAGIVVPAGANLTMATQTIRSEVAGGVGKIVASPGDVPESDRTLLMLKSMKMEIPALARDGGRVVRLLVAEGETVREGQELAVVET